VADQRTGSNRPHAAAGSLIPISRDYASPRLASPSPSLPFRQSILCHLSLSLPPPVRLRHMSCSPLSQCLFQASFLGGVMGNSPPQKAYNLPPKPTEAANVLNKISCPLACSWYYCVHFIARSKAACALRFSWAATSSNLGL